MKGCIAGRNEQARLPRVHYRLRPFRMDSCCGWLAIFAFRPISFANSPSSCNVALAPFLVQDTVPHTRLIDLDSLDTCSPRCWVMKLFKQAYQRLLRANPSILCQTVVACCRTVCVVLPYLEMKHMFLATSWMFESKFI